MIDLQVFKNLSRNAMEMGFVELGERLGYDPPPHPGAPTDAGHDHVNRVWKGMNSIYDAVRNLDDATLRIICGPKDQPAQKPYEENLPPPFELDDETQEKLKKELMTSFEGVGGIYDFGFDKLNKRVFVIIRPGEQLRLSALENIQHMVAPFTVELVAVEPKKPEEQAKGDGEEQDSAGG